MPPSSPTPGHRPNRGRATDRLAPTCSAPTEDPDEAQPAGSQPRSRAGPGDRGRSHGRRPLGRPRRQEQAPTVPPSRPCATLISTVSMRGVVVIGEGEKDNAPMLFNGEQVGDGTGPEVDVAVDPIDGTTLTAKGMNNAVAVMAVANRGAMYDPSRRVLHGQARDRPRRGRRRRHPPPGRREHPAHRQGQEGDARPTSPSSCSTVRATTSSPRRSATPAPASATSSTVTSPAPSWRPVPAPASTCSSASAAPRRASSPPAPSSAPAASSRAGSGPRTTRSARRPSTPATTSTASCPPTTSSSGECFFVATGITDGELLRGVRYGAKSARTNSLVMRSRSGTIRTIDSEHRFDRPGLVRQHRHDRRLRLTT